MSIDVIILLLFAPIVCGLLYTGYRINREERARELQEAASAPGDADTAAALPIEPAAPRSWAVYEIERRLRHELALARAFSADPSVETLWLR